MTTRKFRSAMFLAALFGVPAMASAQESLSTVVFSPGDNGGALPVAQSFYGQSQAMETAIIDINDDGAAEIAVKFTEGCEDGRCATSILYYSNNSWVELFKDATEALYISSSSWGGMKEIHSSDDVKWRWVRGAYHPLSGTGELIWEAGTPTTVLSAAEAKHPYIRNMSEIERYELDLNGDGRSESIVLSTSGTDCGPRNACPIIIHSSDDRFIGFIYANEGRLLSLPDELRAPDPNGFSSYSIDGQSLTHLGRHDRAEIRGN